MSRIVPVHTNTRQPLPRRIILGALATAALALVFAAPATAQRDLRSPDARDAAGQAAAGSQAEVPARADLRSPDARDAGRQAGEPMQIDLRSPDARDAGRVAPRTAPPATHPTAGNLDWQYLAVGLLALIIVASLTVTIRRRRRRPVQPAHS